jgi:hypothetical protein
LPGDSGSESGIVKNLDLTPEERSRLHKPKKKPEDELELKIPKIGEPHGQWGGDPDTSSHGLPNTYVHTIARRST